MPGEMFVVPSSPTSQKTTSFLPAAISLLFDDLVNGERIYSHGRAGELANQLAKLGKRLLTLAP